MTVSLKHGFVSAQPDGSDADLVQPSNWNAEHTLTLGANVLLGAVTAGAAQEIGLGAGLSFSAGNLTASGFAATAHTHIIANVTGLQAALDGKEASITAGTTAQYWRGDKSFQTLDKTAVGLANVDNTSDANKPVSTAQSTAIGLKLNAAAVSAFGLTLVDDANAAAARTTLGLSTVAETGNATDLNPIFQNTFLGNANGVAAPPEAISIADLNSYIPVFTDFDNGITPASGGGTTKYLRADATWATPTIPSGWSSYVHTGAAQVLVANTKVTLTNDAGTVIQVEKPADIASFYTAGLVTGRVGDSIIIGINLTFTPSSALASKIYMAIDIGGAIGEIEPDEFMVLNGSGVAHRINYTKAPYMGATFAANGGAIKVMADGPGSITAMIYTIHRLHKA